MLSRMKTRPWLWACLFATVLTTLGWLALPLDPPKSQPPVWSLLVGLVIEFPAFMVVGTYALIVTGGAHDLEPFLAWVPPFTWIFYLCLFYWLLSRKASTAKGAGRDKTPHH